MPPALAALLRRVAETWAALPTSARRLALGLAGVGALAALGLWAASGLMVDYQVLFSNLTPEDTTAVVDALRAARVPYRVADGQVLVPAARVHEWRLKLASQGVPASGNVGFEIFDKNQFGLTDFAQRLNFQRAVQGELARTIGQLKEVQQARVHLALPAPRVFTSQERPASAAVVLRLRPGASLRPEQVRGIVHLVSSSVEGLAPDRVTVVDSSGRMLASGVDRVAGLSANQLEARSAVEQDIERRVQTLLDPIVGPGRSAVRVSALVNFDQIERTEERFDPTPLVRTQARTSETLQGASSQPSVAPPPAAGASAPTPPPPATATNRTERSSEQTTYEIARTVERTVVAPGDIKRLSVAVLLDVPLVNGERVPRSEEELERIKRLVASAAGIRADRDELEVQQVPFDPSVAAPGDAPQPQAAPAPARRPAWWWAWGAGALLALATLGAVLWRAWRRRRALESAMGAAFDGRNVLPEGAAAPPAAPPALDLGTEEHPLKRQVLKAAQEHPDEVAQLLRAWMFRRRATAT